MRTMPTPVGAPPADVSGALHVCPGYIEIAGEKHPCDQQAVLPPGSHPVIAQTTVFGSPHLAHSYSRRCRGLESGGGSTNVFGSPVSPL